MRKLGNKATIISLILAFAVATSLTLPSVIAHTPPWTLNTYCYIATSPQTVGVNQEVIISVWLNAVPPTAVGGYGDRWTFYVDITLPDGSNETLGPIKSDPVGGSYTIYVPTQVGTYTLVGRFPGHTLTGMPTSSGQPSTDVNVNDTFTASTSKKTTIIVQEDQIPRYTETPLPTGYWTRPIYDTNRGWGSTVMGQWLGGAYYENLRTQGIPYTTAPESSHILWTRSMWSGGIMGGQSGDIAYYNGIAYEGFASPLVVLEGKAYYPIQTVPRYGWYCIDLYTGETIYYENNTDGATTVPTLGQVLDIENPNQYGGFPYLWRTSGVGTNTWEMLDGFTGKAICKIANVSTSGTQFRDSIGSICYVNFVNLGTTANPNYYMQVWNTTEAIWWRQQYGVYPPKTLLNGSTIPATTTSNDAWYWRPGATIVGMSSQGYTTYDGRNGYSMNVSVASILGPRNTVVNQTGTIREVIPDEYVVVGTAGQNDARGNAPGFLRAYSLKRPNWGQILWDITFTAPRATDEFPNNTYSGGVSFGGLSSKDNVFWFTERVTGKIWVYSIATGQQLWTYTINDQWYYYGTSLTVNNGKAYTISTTGVLNCFNATTGAFLWNWTAPSIGYLETEGLTYTPLSLAFFIDDPLTGRQKVYLHGSTGWAGQTSPIRRDGAIFCVDTTTGEMLWRLTAYPSYANNALSRVIVSEGRIIYLDNHDNQIYCLGKGPSATTVTAPQNVPFLGSSVMITGTVTDQSPSGRRNINGNLDFTLKGTPAIADEYMDAWMEYMFHQRPIPANAKGVEVSLDALDPNSNFIHIGTVVSDINGNYGCVFTPEVPGTYKIIATFAGSASYGASSATTYLAVDEAPPATAPPEYPQPIDYTLHFVVTGIAIIIAIIVVGLWTKKK
ncbi:MAG: PQQ-binding-like beta-propeller repeat protein [Candidatus Bathyarchaeota archaeon]|nr:PQQ-binding-like beta-propeller repeat protein [Candidatus Bathyarchaeota archaeon]